MGDEILDRVEAGPDGDQLISEGGGTGSSLRLGPTMTLDTHVIPYRG